MKLKSLLLAAVAAGMAMTASAEVYTGSGDYLTAEDLTIKAGETAKVEIKLQRNTEFEHFVERWKGGQFNLIFPEGIRPYGEQVWDEDNEEYLTVYGTAINSNHTASDNMDVEANHPDYMVVLANLTATGIKPNPTRIYNLNIKADADAVTSDVELKFHNLKYIDNEDNTLHILTGEGESAPVCKIHIDGISGVKDLNVAAKGTYKTVENGQVIIVKNGVKYNTVGQIVK